MTERLKRVMLANAVEFRWFFIKRLRKKLALQYDRQHDFQDGRFLSLYARLNRHCDRVTILQRKLYSKTEEPDTTIKRAPELVVG